MSLTTSHDLARSAGVTLKQVWHWAARGYLRPEDRVHAASGKPLLFSPREVEVGIIMGRLVAAGMRVQPAADLARYMRTTRVHRVRVWDGVIIEVEVGLLPIDNSLTTSEES